LPFLQVSSTASLKQAPGFTSDSLSVDCYDRSAHPCGSHHIYRNLFFSGEPVPENAARTSFRFAVLLALIEMFPYFPRQVKGPHSQDCTGEYLKAHSIGAAI